MVFAEYSLSCSPTHQEEDEALEFDGSESCEEIAWAIEILRAAIAWRLQDLADHPEDANNIIGRGHRTRIEILQRQLDFLVGVYRVQCEILG